MGPWGETIHGLKPTLLMVLMQTILSLVNVGYKLAANDGMSLPVLVAYRFMFGAAFIAPIAFFVERKKRPKLTKRVALYGFLCGLFGGSLGQNLYLKSLALTSATFVSAMANLVPAVTFVIAICLRLEKLGWNTRAGKAKVFGTLLGIGGAMVFTFYKGLDLSTWKTGINLLEITSSHRAIPNTQSGHKLVIGLVLGLASVVSYSSWLIVQAKAAELYPCPYSITAMMTISASIQGTVFALCIERDWSQWILGWNIRLLTVFVAGTLGSGLMFTIVAWCVRMRGPLFVSIFNPLLLVMVAIAGNLFLEEKIYLGMVFGSIFIISGLYIVLWGKSKEMKKLTQLTPENEVEGSIGNPPPSRNGSSHGGGSTKVPPSHKGSSLGGGSIKGAGEEEEEEEEEEEKRDSHASSEVLSGLYIYP